MTVRVIFFVLRSPATPGRPPRYGGTRVGIAFPFMQSLPDDNIQYRSGTARRLMSGRWEKLRGFVVGSSGGGAEAGLDDDDDDDETLAELLRSASLASLQDSAAA